MKLTFVLLTATFLQLSARGLTQNVTLTLKDAPVEKVFKEIERQTGLGFLYTKKMLQDVPRVSINVNNVPVADVLQQCFKEQQLDYSIESNTIVISRKATIAPVVDELPLINVRGRVVNEKGEPVDGATVTVKGTKIATATDINGFFELKGVDENATLVITGVNVDPFEIKLNGRTNLETINVKTKITENTAIAVNTGFQTISKERATGASDRVTEKILEKRPYPSLASALVGQIAGLVSEGSGFTIRGRSTISGDRAVLLVVDGFPIEGGFSSINPNDVKSVDVLKDAAATSIYGARASNGVIVVTTKGTGPRGKMNVSYSTQISIGEQIDLDNFMNIADSKTQIDYEDRMHSVFKGTAFIADPYNNATGTFRGIRSPYTTLILELGKGNITKEYFDREREKMLNSNYKDDYYKYLLRNYFYQQHNITISGTGEKNSYKFSVLYDNDLTSYQFNNNDKLLMNFTNIYNISNNIRYQVSGNLTSYNQRNNGISLSQAKAVTAPWTKLIDEEGNYTRMMYQNYEPLVKTFEKRLPYSMRYNILEESSLKDNRYEGLDLRIQNQFEIKIMEGLRFTPMFQYELFKDESVSIYDERMYASRNYANIVSKYDSLSKTFISQIPKGGIYRKNSASKRQSIKVRAQFDFARIFGNKHEVVALAGAEIISSKNNTSFPELLFGYNTKGLNYALFDYNVDRLDMFNQTVLENSQSYEGNLIYNYKASGFRQSNRFNERYLAAYFNGSYTFDKRYTVTLSARTDASNYVAKTVRDKFSPFYSGGLLWNLKNEKFMNKVDFVDRLTLRTSYGVTGLAAGKNSVQAVTVFSSQAATAETGNLTNGFLSGRDNDFLTWEKTYSTNIGTDFSLFRGKLTGSVDLYNRHTKDVLSTVPTSQVIQSTSSLSMNLGELLNRGIELSLGSNINIARDFNWNGVVNFDYNYNEVLKFDYINPTLFNYLGGNRPTSAYIPGLPTDFLLMTRLVGTTKDGYFVQVKKNGELVVANNTANSFSNVSRSTIPGLRVSDDDRVYYQGRTTPPSTIGFTNTFNYKGFSLMAVITGRFGYKFRMTDQSLNYALSTNNYSASGLASLQAPSLIATTNTGNVLPTISNQAMIFESSNMRNFYSEAVVADASHIRLNEVYLGYQFSDKLIRNIRFFKSATLFTQARNLGLLWKANDNGYDPEFPLGTVKPVRTFTFGAKITM